MNEFNVDFRFEDGLLYVSLCGKYPKESFLSPKNLFQPLIDACSTHQCRKALVDAREMQANFATLELYRAGLDAVSLTDAGLRVALLAREDMRDPFFDTVVSNRAGVIGVFTDMGAARAWLQR